MEILRCGMANKVSLPVVCRLVVVVMVSWRRRRTSGEFMTDELFTSHRKLMWIACSIWIFNWSTGLIFRGIPYLSWQHVLVLRSCHGCYLRHEMKTADTGIGKQDKTRTGSCSSEYTCEWESLVQFPPASRSNISTCIVPFLLSLLQWRRAGEHIS